MGRMLGLGMLLVCGLVGAQSRGREAVRVFLPAWYAAARAGTTMPAPVVGVPVSARFLVADLEGGTESRGRSPVEDGRGAWRETRYTFARDGRGRVRLEREGAYHPEIPETNMQHEATEVMVADPVSRCTFRWWVGELASHRVSVMCMQKDAAFEAAVPWDEQNRAERVYRVMHPESRFVDEPLHAKKMFGLVEAEGYRRFEVRTNETGEEGRSYCGERWYAPALKELVMSTTPKIGTRYPQERTDFEATVTSLAEPAASLFYPPAGWAIGVVKEAGQ